MGKVLILFGAPGSGKGTQGEMLEQKLGLPRVSTGDLFRALPDRGVGAEIKAIMKQGGLVPDGKVLEMLREELSSPKYANGFLLDGYPRTIPQAEALEKLLASLGHSLEHVAYLNVSTPELKRRLGGRWTCRDCNKIYSFVNVQPTAACRACNGELYQRPDDAPAGVEARLKTYAEKTAPLIKHYASNGLLREVRVPDHSEKEGVFKLVLEKLGLKK